MGPEIDIQTAAAQKQVARIAADGGTKRNVELALLKDTHAACVLIGTSLFGNDGLVRLIWLG